MTFVAWRNGEFIDSDSLSVPFYDLGVVAGATVTEMARTFRHQPFRLEDHIRRLLKSCHELEFSTPYSLEQLAGSANEVVRRNSQQLSADSDLGIVIFVTAGPNLTYLGNTELPPPTIAVHTFELPFSLWQTAARDGVQLVTPERRQPDESDFPVHLKTRNRIHWWLADREANRKKAGARSLLLDHQHRITETSTSAFYAVIEGQVLTPAANTLNSMSRRIVEQAAEAAGITFVSHDLRLEDLDAATECFVSSTPVGVLPVASVNEKQFAVKATNSILPRLLDYWRSETGLNPMEQILSAG